MSLKRDKIFDILYHSFYENNSTQFVVRQDHKKEKRLRLLIQYSIWQAEKWGELHLNDSEDACMLIIFPHKKKFSLKSIMWDVKLAVGCIGLGNIKKVMHREKLIKSAHPNTPFIYLWYIGVSPQKQGRGLGTDLIGKLKFQSDQTKQPIILETSSKLNYRFYENQGFEMIMDLKESGYGLRTYRYQK